MLEQIASLRARAKEESIRLFNEYRLGHAVSAKKYAQWVEDQQVEAELLANYRAKRTSGRAAQELTEIKYESAQQMFLEARVNEKSQKKGGRGQSY